MLEQPEWWVSALAMLFDLSLERSAALIQLFDDPSCWLVGATEGTAVIRVPPGGGQRGVVAVLVRAPVGRRIPREGEWAEELVLMLKGAVEDDDGRQISAGKMPVSLRGHARELLVISAEECWCAMVMKARA